MTAPVALPLWLVVLVVVLAAWSALDRLLIPSVRWFLRRRVNRVIDEFNARLKLRIQPFKLTRREVLIDRLVYDPEVVAAADEFAAERDMPRQVAMVEVERYAREIVPAFNAYVYFRIGYWLARRIAESLYRVRLGYADDEGLAGVDPDATVVFVINHRSNMDYVLVSYLAMRQAALSYAVGEWARVWPLQQLIRAMGAFFVRRNSRNALYRRVLERYVHMAVQGGVTQAVFPEGGLSLDGALRPPKLGLLDYMTKGFDPAGERDVVFLPVGINYDRVLEDRTLLRAHEAMAAPVPAGRALATALGFLARNLRLMLFRRWYRFGYACVNFGPPLSLRDWLAAGAGDLRALPKDDRFREMERLAETLMARIAGIIPVLPVSLVATVFAQAGETELGELELKAACQRLRERLTAAGAKVFLPRGEEDYAISVGLRMLTLRHLVDVLPDGRYRTNAAERPALEYYANAIAHLRDS